MGHYRRAGLFLEDVVKCCGGTVISIKRPKERKNVEILRVVLRKPSCTLENETLVLKLLVVLEVSLLHSVTQRLRQETQTQVCTRTKQVI